MIAVWTLQRSYQSSTILWPFQHSYQNVSVWAHQHSYENGTTLWPLQHSYQNITTNLWSLCEHISTATKTARHCYQENLSKRSRNTWEFSSRLIYRVGHNRIYAPYMTVCLVIFLPIIPCIHSIYMVLANPILSAIGVTSADLCEVLDGQYMACIYGSG